MNKQIKKINTRTITLTILFILILIVIALLIGKFTYSYLAPTIDDDVEGVGEVTASGDTIIFTKGNTLSLSATTDNFKTGGSNLTSTTNPKVKLMASSKTSSASSTYFAGIIIKNNTYKYTTTNKLPEVILTVKDENGNIVETSADNLNFVTVNDNLKGFDITGVTGPFNIVKEYPIATPTNKTEVIHTWTFTLTFVNLETDQSENENSTLEMDVVLQRSKIPTSVADFCTNGDGLNDCIVTFYNNLKNATNMYYHDTTLPNGGEDNSYRYAGANPNNYVCFGSDEETCSYENLYRIIGLIDGKIKLILADGATSDMLGTNAGYSSNYSETRWSTAYYKGNGDLTKISVYYWDSTNINTWSESTTNITNLNTNYLTYLDGKASKWKKMIADTTWYVGGFTFNNGIFTNAKTAYDYEVGANKDVTLTLTSKIGLMYVSDYYYAASEDYWTLPGFGSGGNNYEKSINNNWMYIGLYEWTISKIKNSTEDTTTIVGTGYTYSDYVSDPHAIRPTFNLVPSIKYVSGTGIQSDPIRLSL